MKNILIVKSSKIKCYVRKNKRNGKFYLQQGSN